MTHTITLALGGGGARGVAHLGAVEALLEAECDVERIVGVSIGSLAGALCAFDPDIRAVQARTVEYIQSPTFQKHQRHLFGADRSCEDTGGIFSWYQQAKLYLRANRLMHRVLRSPSLMPGWVLDDVISHLLPDIDIREASVPLTIVAVDLHTGRKVALNEGPLRAAVRGSAALPGIFPPVPFGEMLLCDVGVFHSLPTLEARETATELVVAVDVSSPLKPLSRCDTAMDVMMRMDEIGQRLFLGHVRAEADLLICPDVEGIEWYDFSSPQRLVEAGRAATRLALRGFSPPPIPRERVVEPSHVVAIAESI